MNTVCFKSSSAVSSSSSSNTPGNCYFCVCGKKTKNHDVIKPQADINSFIKRCISEDETSVALWVKEEKIKANFECMVDFMDMLCRHGIQEWYSSKSTDQEKIIISKPSPKTPEEHTLSDFFPSFEEVIINQRCHFKLKYEGFIKRFVLEPGFNYFSDFIKTAFSCIREIDTFCIQRTIREVRISSNGSEKLPQQQLKNYNLFFHPLVTVENILGGESLSSVINNNEVHATVEPFIFAKRI